MELYRAKHKECLSSSKKGRLELLTCDWLDTTSSLSVFSWIHNTIYYIICVS